MKYFAYSVERKTESYLPLTYFFLTGDLVFVHFHQLQ